MKLENIFKSYFLNNDKIAVLEDITYSFKKGKFYLIKGHSGSGKSTLIQIMGLMLQQGKGTIYVNDKDISNLSENQKSELRKNVIGFIFQNYCLNDKLTALDNVILPMLINKKIEKKDRKDRALELLDMVGLSDRLEHYPDELSGGEQQRVAIARALANNPEIILADEPTGNLDKKNEKEILNIMKKIVKNGKTVIMVSHSDEAEKYADVVLSLDNGKLTEVV